MADNEHKRTEGSRMTKSAGKEITSSGKIGGDFSFQENPEFLERRLAVYEKIKAKREEEDKEQPREPIEIVLPDGTVKEGTSFETSPMDIAQGISQGLANVVIVAKVRYTNRLGNAVAVEDSSGFEVEEEEAVVDKGELWDLTRPLEGSCKLELLKFDEEEAKMVFWHSSAHVLGECMECKMGSHLTVGPPVNPGFYYDTYLGKESIDDDLKAKLQKDAQRVTKAKQKFERIVLTKEEALEMFQDNPFKVSIITNKIKDGARTTAYRCGSLIDLCMGPHVVHTGKIKTFEITKQSSAYWLGEAENDSLQRVYGISFPDKAGMKLYKEFIKNAEANDHRRRGAEQDLFFFHQLSPGCCFFLPHGSRIYNTLTDFIKSEYQKRGYDEVMTPNIFNVDLWKQSGHWQHYKDNMFSLTDGEAKDGPDGKGEPTQYALKPMNCPGHCLVFGHTSRSHRELPIRMADFGVLHRNEISGALSGLTRVRRFQQDDAHIFCKKSQIREEVLGVLDFMKSVYAVFGMSFKLERSTRPKKAIGLETPEGVAMWDFAEEELAQALDTFVGKGNWRDNIGDGAFYGPKIDIKIYDAYKREHQCATVQLDFQLPLRFDLKYMSDSESLEERPVIIHRAILGSVERMFGVLTEHYGGIWPFWLSPRQVMIVPIHSGVFDYATDVKKQLTNVGLFAEVDYTSKTLNKKIRNAQKDKHTFILVVGNGEEEAKAVNVRTENMGILPIQEAIEFFLELKDNKTPNGEEREKVMAKFKKEAPKDEAQPPAPKE